MINRILIKWESVCTNERTDGFFLSKGGLSLKIGYIRIDTADQNTARQEVLMHELGVEQVFIDRMSGKNTDRPELRR